MTSAADLFALQELDLQRDSRRAIIADVDARLGETSELIAAREELQAAEEQAADIQKQQRELEAQIRDLDDRIKPLETKLYDGSVRNPKELTDLQKEVESFKAKRSQLDDEALRNLEILEVAQSAVQEAREDLERIEAAWQAEQEKMRRDRARAEEDMTRLDAAREQRTKSMDARSLGIYEQLRAAKQGRAVARVERGTCQGCRVTLPTNMLHKVRDAEALVQCPRCERILVAG